MSNSSVHQEVRPSLRRALKHLRDAETEIIVAMNASDDRPEGVERRRLLKPRTEEAGVTGE